MRPRDVSTLLSSTLTAGLPVLLTGAPGVGKTDLVRQATESAGMDLVVSHPVVSDPTDAKGLPWPSADNTRAHFLPCGEVADLVACERPTVWLLDDLGQAPAAVQAAYMQWLLARRVNGHVLPDHVTMVAATNRRHDRAGVQGILEPVKSRFATIVEVEPSLDDWCRWALGAGIASNVIAFLRYRPELLCSPDPTLDMRNSPSPRTWASLSRLVTLDLPPAIRQAAYAGAVGEGASVEFSAYETLSSALVSADAILLDPQGSPIPEGPGELFAVSTALATRASGATAGRILTYAERMRSAGHGEFAVLAVRDSQRRNAGFGQSPEFVAAMSGPMGELILGEAQ
jgi:hypothetical protein